ncbi:MULTISPECIES: TadE/TadG family type IV pilus assembly protein [unclassified Streptomyces]|uniref:TadE/TadG family type IV pilus assembly protein n=1 Tax=unclassified Streptomyces TaxID=2593676 RepID=UPI002E819AF2|nr:TadE/TadG family type IV pilus assembly protein [Streptomyces sp. NBC_00589]WTI37081.1 pilus assembly protein [Streptomyces sp. NBC_00775]WUB29243.1 pilus assembly protein [Streptomyces sp. NBC_00589]
MTSLLSLVRDRISRDSDSDRGLSTIEVVILAPVMILFILVLVAFGQMVDGRGALDGAARDAARAGSIQKEEGVAMSEARKAADADLSDVCSGPVTVTKTSAGWANAELFTVEVSCEVRGLAMLGLDIPTHLTASFTSPLDPFKRKA